MGPKPRPLGERFFEKTSGAPTAAGCLVWLGSKHRNGYGQFSQGNKKLLAHRTAWFLAYGEWPTGVVMHSCDNPACVNIRHLSLGTHKENSTDASRKGRMWCKLNTQQVAAIKHQYAAGGVTQKQLAVKFGVYQNTIHQILSGRIWAHVSCL